jgi:hypothetical protein
MLLAAVRDLLRGLLGFPLAAAADPAAGLERRYRGPGRCC